MIRIISILCVVLRLSLPVISQSPSPKANKGSLTQKGLEVLFESEISTKLDPPFQAGMKNLRTAYKNSLDASLKRHSSAGELDEALALKEELTRFLKEGTVPDGDQAEQNAEILRLRMAWRAEVGRLKEQWRSGMKPIVEAHAARLRALELELTKAMKLDEAKAVRDRTSALLVMGEQNPQIPNTPFDGSNMPAKPSPVAEGAAGNVASKKLGDEQAITVAEIKSLPEEDQSLLKGLKFSNPEPASLDSRGNTYISGRITVTNTNPFSTITDKLQIETRLLCRDNDKKWGVIRGASPLQIVEKGKKVLHYGVGGLGNDLFEKLNGGRRSKLHGVYTAIRYQGIVCFESHPTENSALPKDWWKDDALIAK